MRSGGVNKSRSHFEMVAWLVPECAASVCWLTAKNRQSVFLTDQDLADLVPAAKN
jgi:hypothetical protein